MKEISDYLEKTDLGVNINYIVQEQQNGTGHAVNQAKGKIKQIIARWGSSNQYC